MTQGRILADRLVERVFGNKKETAVRPEQPRELKSISGRAKAAAEASREREAMIRKFEEF